jgi:plastocyanin
MWYTAERMARRHLVRSPIALAFALGLLLSACGSGSTRGADDATATGTTRLLGPDTFPCEPAPHDLSYQRYGVGRMRRGGLEPEALEPNHVVIAGEAINLHETARVQDGGAIEMEMDDDYFEPSILVGAPGATVTLELENDGVRPHNLFVPGQGIDIRCGVRAEDEVEVTFPTSGVLVFRCRYTATSGMRGALRVA